jgi:hypothetical protein
MMPLTQRPCLPSKPYRRKVLLIEEHFTCRRTQQARTPALCEDPPATHCDLSSVDVGETTNGKYADLIKTARRAFPRGVTLKLSEQDVLPTACQTGEEIALTVAGWGQQALAIVDTASYDQWNQQATTPKVSAVGEWRLGTIVELGSLRHQLSNDRQLLETGSATPKAYVPRVELGCSQFTLNPPSKKLMAALARGKVRSRSHWRSTVSDS